MIRLTRRNAARALVAGAGAATVALATALPSIAHDENHDKDAAGHQATIAAVPPVTSNNVKVLSSFPEAAGISGDYAISTEHFYLSTLNGITVFDISDPAVPVVQGKYLNSQFENEAMNYGERRENRQVTDQFVMIGVDLQSVDPTDPQHVNLGDGQELIIVDVEDPMNPHKRSSVKVTTSTHTVSCIREIQCRFAYTAGSRGKFSILDLRDLDNPQEVDSNLNTPAIDPFDSPAAGPGGGFTGGAGHKWNFDRSAIGFHTGSGGTAAFDVSDPIRPKLLTTTGAAGRGEAEGLEGYNNFIHHNSWHPNHARFVPSAPASLQNGNVLLVTEEDYLETDCSLAGSFQTWKINRFGGPASIKPLDKVELADLGGPENFVPPDAAFCSAHWFDHHQSGITAVAYYGGGVRLVDVRDPRNIKRYGYAVGGETWDAYWLPQRRVNGTALLPRTDILYGVDLINGLTVYQVDLPGGDAQPTTAGVTRASYTTGVTTRMNHTCTEQMALGV